MNKNITGQLTFEMTMIEEAGFIRGLNYILKQLLIRKDIYFVVFNKNNPSINKT